MGGVILDVAKRGGSLIDAEIEPSPNFRRGRLEEYARKGFKRTTRVIEEVIERGYAARRSLKDPDTGVCELTLEILHALVDAGCLAPIAAGIADENAADEQERQERAERRRRRDP